MYWCEFVAPSRMHMTESDSVVQWLEDLRLMTETECMCVLQGKSLSKGSTDVVFTAPKPIKGKHIHS